MKQKQLVILGATGSIGDSTLKVVKGNPDKLNVIGKGNKERAIYLNNACINAINEYLAIRPKDGVKFNSKDDYKIRC